MNPEQFAQKYGPQVAQLSAPRQRVWTKNGWVTADAYEQSFKPTKTRGRGGFLSSLISEGGAAGGATAGGAIGTSIAPGPGTIIGAGIGGLIGGFTGRGVENKVRDNRNLFGAGSEGSWKQALGEGALSGALSVAGTGFQAAKAAKGAKALGKVPGAVGAVDDVTKAAKLSAGPNSLVRRGNSWYRATLGVDDIVMPGKMKPTTIASADDLVKEARRVGLKGSPAQMTRQVNEQYEFLNIAVDDILSKSKNTTSAANIIKQAEKDVLSKLPATTREFPVRAEFLNSLGSLGKGKVNAKNLYDFKNSLDVSSAFKKLSTGGSLTAKETVDLALWKQADDWIAGNAGKGIKGLAPAAKELTKRQSNLYGLSEGLGRMTRTPGDPSSVVALGARVLSPTVRKAQNLAGRAMLTAGGAGNSVAGAGGGFLSQATKQAKFQAPGNLFQAMGGSAGSENSDQLAGQDSGYGTGGMEDTGYSDMAQDPYPQQQEAPQQSLYSLEQALADIQGDPKNTEKYLSVYKTVKDSEGGGKGGKMDAVSKRQAANINSAEQIVGQLEGLYGQAGGAKGFGGYLTKLTSKTPLNSQQKAYSDQRGAYISRLVRALGEVGTLNEGDIQRAVALIPDYTDTKESAAMKWAGLRSVLNNTKQSLYDTAGSRGGLEEALMDSGYGQQYGY